MVSDVGEATGICNGCGKREATSREHLVHVAVARVLLKDRQIRTGKERDEAFRSDPFFARLQLYRDPLEGEPERPISMSVWIRDLLCPDCNGGWAKKLEEDAGNDLYQFVHLHRPASVDLRGWAFYFAIKLWWSQRRAELLRWGDLVPVMRSIKETRDVSTSVRVAQVGGAERWKYASSGGRWTGNPPHIVFIIWGVVFIVTRAPKGAAVPWPSVELGAGIARKDLPRLATSDIRSLLSA
jgi:hypothetical protein